MDRKKQKAGVAILISDKIDFKKFKKMEDSQTRFMKPASSYSQNQIKT